MTNAWLDPGKHRQTTPAQPTEQVVPGTYGRAAPIVAVRSGLAVGRRLAGDAAEGLICVAEN
jgi:hypothetical protein